MKKKAIINTLLSLMMVFILVSCIPSGNNGSQNQSDNPVNDTEILITPIQPEISRTAESHTTMTVAIVSKTLTMTQTIEPTPTRINTLTPTLTATMFGTLFFEIPNSDDGQKVEYLLETNGGCKFPCLWGFLIPGETEWEIAESTIDGFVKNCQFKFTSENYADNLYNLLDSEGYFLGELYIGGKDIITDIHLEDIKHYFPISKILHDYGRPKDILFYSENFFNPGGQFNFQLILDYGDKNFFIQYYEPDPAKKGMADGKAWWEYGPDAVASVYFSSEGIEEYLKYYSREFGWRFYPLSEITGMDVDAFYNHFMSGNETLMIEFYPEELQGKLDGE